MFIKKLNIHNFRSIVNKEFVFSNHVNIFYGNNGVGKTSILEAIHFISSGKSFRKSNIKNLINFKYEDLTVYIETSDNNKDNFLSVNKNKLGKWKGKINGNNIKKQSQITNILPIISIDPEIYRLVDSGPLFRRNYLDWVVFHVKHNYLDLWKKVYKCIKNLNFLYKNKAPTKDLVFWEQNYIVFSNELTEIRKSFFNKVSPKIIKLSTYLQEDLNNISIKFNQGWPDNVDLQEQLNIDRKKNMLYGQLQHGPHKMDIQIRCNGQYASKILSRGQKKTLSISFYMACVELLLEYDIKPILCLDDLDAELDSIRMAKAAEFFTKTETQLFITTVQKESLKKAFKKPDVFHVKQ